MKEKSILNKIKKVLGIEVKLDQMKLDNGTVVEADSFDVGAEIFVVSGTDRIPLPVGDYKLQDGGTLTITEDGIIGDIQIANAAPAPAPAAQSETPVAANETSTAKKVVESTTKETHFTKEEMLSEIDKLRNEFNEKFEKLSKQEKPEEKTELEVKPIKHSPEAEVSKKEPILYSQNRTYGTKELVFKRLFNN